MYGHLQIAYECKIEHPKKRQTCVLGFGSMGGSGSSEIITAWWAARGGIRTAWGGRGSAETVSLTVEPREKYEHNSVASRSHNWPAIVVWIAYWVCFFWVIWPLNRFFNSAIRASSFSFAVGILGSVLKLWAYSKVSRSLHKISALLFGRSKMTWAVLAPLLLMCTIL